MPGMGRYQGLKAIRDSQQVDEEIYNALPPDACPNCGWPLDVNAAGERNCPAGDYRYVGGKRLT